MMLTQIEYEDSEEIKTKIVEGENTQDSFSSFLRGMEKIYLQGLRRGFSRQLRGSRPIL